MANSDIYYRQTQGLADAIANLTDRVRHLESLPSAAQSYTNLLLNGGFEKWTLGPGPFTSGVCADNWTLSIATGSSMSVVQDSANQDSIASTYCATVTYANASPSFIYQSVPGPFTDTPIAISARVKTSQVGAVRLTCGAKNSGYHSGSGLYETLVVVAVPSVQPFIFYVEFDATCLASIDSIMCVQGSHPIEYIYQG